MSGPLRVVLFDNKTGDQGRKRRQVAELLRAVDAVIGRNGGRPYTGDLAEEAAALRRAAHVPGETSSEGATLGLRADLEREYAEKLHAVKAEIEEKLGRELERSLELQREEGTRNLEAMQSLHDAERRRAEEEAKKSLEQGLEKSKTKPGTAEAYAKIVCGSIPTILSVLAKLLPTPAATCMPLVSGIVAPPVAQGLSQSRLQGLAMELALKLQDPQAWNAHALQVENARLVMDQVWSALQR